MNLVLVSNFYLKYHCSLVCILNLGTWSGAHWNETLSSKIWNTMFEKFIYYFPPRPPLFLPFLLPLFCNELHGIEQEVCLHLAAAGWQFSYIQIYSDIFRFADCFSQFYCLEHFLWHQQLQIILGQKRKGCSEQLLDAPPPSTHLDPGRQVSNLHFTYTFL